MRIKHWQGYGSVTAKKISKTVKHGITTLVVEVNGNHEYGLVRDDIYHLKEWLLDKFDKEAVDLPPYEINYSYDDGYRLTPDGLDEEYCVYTFTYAI